MCDISLRKQMLQYEEKYFKDMTTEKLAFLYRLEVEGEEFFSGEPITLRRWIIKHGRKIDSYGRVPAKEKDHHYKAWS